MRKLLLASLVAAGVFGQSNSAFEVASIKPAARPTDRTSGRLHVGMSVDGARVDIGFFSIADLIREAYQVKPYQITGPAWMSSQRWDIVAKLPEGASRDQVPAMLQALLAERFGLKLHHETKEHSVYALVVGKNGSKLKESTPEVEVPAEQPTGGISIKAGDQDLRVNRNEKGVVVRGGKSGTTRISMTPGGMMHMEAEKMTLTQLTESLSGFLDRPVLDMTDLKGNYQVAMDFSMSDLQSIARKAGVMMSSPTAGGDGGKPPGDAPSASDPSGGSIVAAVQQLGLKLDPRKMPLDFLVVDHLEKAPTEN